MNDLERSLKAVANRRRLAIIKYLKSRREAKVGDIATVIKLSFRSTSRHLATLASADILEKEQRSLEVYYRLASPLPSAVKNILPLV